MVPNQTYAMAGVTSVRSERIEPKRGWPIFLLVIGFLLLFISEVRGVGVVLVLIAIAWLIVLKPTFAVALRSASGETRAIQSQDSAFISSVVEALNQAIVYRR